MFTFLEAQHQCIRNLEKNLKIEIMRKDRTKKSIVTLAILCAAMGILSIACSKESVIEAIDTIEDAIETELTLDNLNGDWIRVASNNAVADGIIIAMSATSGEITDKAGSGFNVGDIKWKGIQATDEENFKYEELGSDGNYYPATMLLKSDDTLRISVGSSGAGNVQKWVREGEYIPMGSQGSDTTETLPCNITEARTLVNGSAAIDYIIECVVDITALLTIEPGTVIQFKENAGLGVYDGGTINAVGTVAEPIVLKGEEEIDGFWRGIHIETRSANNQLDNVRIQDAGSNYVYCCNDKASLYLKGAKIALDNLQLSNGGGIGIMAVSDTELMSYSNVRIETHKDYPVHIEAESAGYLDGIGSDYSGNDKDFVFVPRKSIDEPTVWAALNVPYLIDGMVLDVKSAFTLEAGVNMVFQQNGGLGVFDAGSLTVNGTGSAPVVMKGASATAGFWRGIHMETNDLNNSLNYLQVSDAGGNYVYCCNEVGSLFLKDGTASVTNSMFSNGKSYGIVTTSKFEFEEYRANTITTHQKAAMYIAATTMGALDGRQSSYLGNDKDHIKVFRSNIDKEITVMANDVPFQIENDAVIDVISKLSLKEGVEIVFEENSGLGVYDNGSFAAIGTSGEKIVFRGAENTTGFWRGIHTETNSVNNVIRYAEIKNAGSNYIYCCNDKAALIIKDGSMTVENSLISQSGGCGIFVKASATLMESSNDFSNNTDGDLCK